MTRKMPIQIFISLLIISCAGSVKMLPEPMEEKNLLIGSILFDVNGYNDKYLTVRENIEIAIVGNYVEKGELKKFGEWTITDENGYFYIANVPDGEFVIKGFRIHSVGAENLTISNELLDPNENYYELKNEDIIYLQANYFDTASRQRIVNFGHHIFTIHANAFIQHERYDALRNVKLSTGEIVSEPPVPQYFLEKFSGTPWTRYLESDML